MDLSYTGIYIFLLQKRMTTHAKHTENELRNKEKKNQKLKIASWNLQGTFQEEALRQLTLELKRYDIAIAAI